jgi:hypothetical protein
LDAPPDLAAGVADFVADGEDFAASGRTVEPSEPAESIFSDEPIPFEASGFVDAPPVDVGLLSNDPTWASATETVAAKTQIAKIHRITHSPRLQSRKTQTRARPAPLR